MINPEHSHSIFATNLVGFNMLSLTRSAVYVLNHRSRSRKRKRPCTKDSLTKYRMYIEHWHLHGPERTWNLDRFQQNTRKFPKEFYLSRLGYKHYRECRRTKSLTFPWQQAQNNDFSRLSLTRKRWRIYICFHGVSEKAHKIRRLTSTYLTRLIRHSWRRCVLMTRETTSRVYQVNTQRFHSEKQYSIF